MGPASIRHIAVEAGINRGSTYETLKALAAKGVVNYLPKGKRRVFQAEDPDQLLKLGERRQQALSQAMEQLRTEVIPERGYAVISTKTLREHLYRPFPNFTRQRESRGIRVRVIAVGEGGDGPETIFTPV